MARCSGQLNNFHATDRIHVQDINFEKGDDSFDRNTGILTLRDDSGHTVQLHFQNLPLSELRDQRRRPRWHNGCVLLRVQVLGFVRANQSQEAELEKLSRLTAQNWRRASRRLSGLGTPSLRRD
jgi:hypothetical protein